MTARFDQSSFVWWASVQNESFNLPLYAIQYTLPTKQIKSIMHQHIYFSIIYACSQGKVDSRWLKKLEIPTLSRRQNLYSIYKLIQLSLVFFWTSPSCSTTTVDQLNWSCFRVVCEYIQQLKKSGVHIEQTAKSSDMERKKNANWSFNAWVSR